MEITAQMVKDLRAGDRRGRAGLPQGAGGAGGDIDQAAEMLREKGAGRGSQEGRTREPRKG